MIDEGRAFSFLQTSVKAVPAKKAVVTKAAKPAAKATTDAAAKKVRMAKNNKKAVAGRN